MGNLTRRLLIMARIASAFVGIAAGAALGSKITYAGLKATGEVIANADLRYGGASLGGLIGWLSLPILLFLSVNAASILLTILGIRLSGENIVRLGVVVLMTGGIFELYRAYMVFTERDLILGRYMFAYVLIGILFLVVLWAPRERTDLLYHLSAQLNLLQLQKQLKPAISPQTPMEFVSIGESVVENLETVWGSEHPKLVDPLLYLGGFYQESGNPKAVLCYRRALGIAEKHLESNDPRRAVIVNNIGSIYRKIGKPDKARECYLKTMEIDRLVFGEWHSEYATDLNNLATTYMDERNYDKAKPLLERALGIDLRTFGPRHYVVAEDYRNWAGILQAEGDFRGAEKFCRQALAILEAYWPNLTLKIAGMLISLADIQASLGDYAQAIQLIERALLLDRKALDPHQIDIGGDLQWLALLEAHRGNRTRAIELIPDILPFHAIHISSMMTVTSEAERLTFLTQLQSFLDFALTLINSDGTPDMKVVVYQLVLSRKGLHLQVSATQQEIALVGMYPQAASIFAALREVRVELAYQMIAISIEQDNQTLEAYERHLNKLKERCEELERELARQVPEVKLQQQIRTTDLREVTSKLPKGSVVVDFVRFTPYRLGATRGESQCEPPRFLVFILYAEKLEEVQMIDLGEAEHIDANIATFRKYVSLPGQDCFSETLEENRDHLLGVCSQLYRSVFSPIIEVLGKDCGNSLILSPDGELNLLPFEALLTEEGKFVIEEYQLSYVASVRDVLHFGQKLGEPSQALIIADPDFDLFTEGVMEQSKGRLFSIDEYVAKDESRFSQDFRNKTFKRLPDIRKEGEKIAELLREQNVPARTWFESEALEGALKIVRAPLILHLATHGFFEEDQETELEYMSARSRGRGRNFLPPNIENPLLRSGLVLAGVNTFLRKGQLMPEAEDGILTGLDACGLNLYGTELVTLSACDTGVGEVHRGEGVFGLRRAFHQAGAGTLVMSLWHVSDEETRVLMEQFYRNLLSGLPKPDALRQAQLNIIYRMREGNLQPKYGFPHPFFWAAFICQGDPTPLRFDTTRH